MITAKPKKDGIANRKGYFSTPFKNGKLYIIFNKLTQYSKIEKKERTKRAVEVIKIDL